MEISTKKEIINNSEKAARIFQAILEAEPAIDRDKEHFWVMGVNAKLRIVFIDLVTLGVLTNTVIHPREVFRLAIAKGVAAIILAHNHPSDDLEPSENDIAATEKLVKAGEILSIPVLDHIIVTETGHYSFKEADKIINIKFDGLKLF